ncbi:MAG: hypothetical protein A2Z09_03770 [Nitrospirae bacterium RBG_16_43_8]|nr:MAG: hypothetical protein A2Z09_03770 [Nitrospirae bacterium RBG_16_43_8]
MKYPDKKLQECLQAYSSYTKDELISTQLTFNPECVNHRAIKILLSQMNDNETGRRHRETIKESRQANTLSRWAIFIAIISLIVAIIALFDKKQTGLKEMPKLELQMPASSSASQSSSKLPTQQEKAQKDKGQK